MQTYEGPSAREIGEILAAATISGRTVPRAWAGRIVTDAGKPDRLASDILADLVELYTPERVAVEGRPFETKLVPKIGDGLWRTSYSELSEIYLESPTRIKRALALLENLGLARRVLIDLPSESFDEELHAGIAPSVLHLVVDAEAVVASLIESDRRKEA